MGATHMRTSRSGRFRVGRMWLNIVSADQLKPALNETTRVFGERVRDRRQALALSQEAAAVRCGIHWTQLGKVERGQRSLRLETIVKIAAGLEVDAGDLVSGLPVPE
jgi:ribosome-binding protein aMBF1 (putative translation factor)